MLHDHARPTTRTAISATSPTAARWRRRRSPPNARSRCAGRPARRHTSFTCRRRAALAACAAARAEGLPLFVETRPLYLHLTAERYHGHEGALYVAQPPLRERADQEALWRGLANGSIDTVGSDHAPWTRELKLDPKLDVVHCRSGVAELDTMLPLLYTEGVATGRLSPERFVALTSTNAARLFGMYPRKGTIAVGSDADIVVWETRERRVVRDADLFSRARHSVYAGRELRAWPHATIRRGEVVFENGKVLGQPGSGRPIRRGAHTAPPPAARADGTAAVSRRAWSWPRAGRIGPPGGPVGIHWRGQGLSPAFAMSASDDENEISRTVPRRGLARETPRVGVVIVVGSGTAPDGLRAPRIVPMEQLTLQIGRRPHPTPTPTDGVPTSLTIPDPTVSSVHARIQRASSGADMFIVQDLGEHERHLHRRQAVAGSGASARRRRAVPGLAGAGVSHRHRGGARGDAGGRGDAVRAARHLLARSGRHLRQAAAARAHAIRDPAGR